MPAAPPRRPLGDRARPDRAAQAPSISCAEPPRLGLIRRQQAGPEVLEVLVEGAAGDAGQLGHASRGDAAVALLGERRRRGLEQPQPLVRADQVGRDAVAAGGRRSGGDGLHLGGSARAGRRSAAARSSPPPRPVSRGPLALEQIARPLEGAFGRLLAEVGAGGEVHQLGQRVPERGPGRRRSSASQTQDSIPPTTKTPVASGGASAGSMSARALSIAAASRSTAASCRASAGSPAICTSTKSARAIAGRAVTNWNRRTIAVPHAGLPARSGRRRFQHADAEPLDPGRVGLREAVLLALEVLVELRPVAAAVLEDRAHRGLAEADLAGGDQHPFHRPLAHVGSEPPFAPSESTLVDRC